MKLMINVFLNFALIVTASCQESRTVKVTVTEEDGVPIEGASTTVTFLGSKAGQTTRAKGATDGRGVFEAKGQPLLRMSVRIEKEGYYTSESDRLSRKKNHSVAFVLRKIKNPIPLYAKKVNLQLPKNRDWLGYDLQIGDWIAPHGEGSVSDVLLRCDTEMTGEMAAKGSFEMRFGELEGIQIVSENYSKYSQMKMPHLAPDGGYINTFLREENSHRDKKFREGIGYFLRTRVVKEGDKIISAHYGKLLTDIGFDPRGSRWYAKKGELKSFATISFTYYFNPTSNDRNLEFDTKKNLFKNLDSTERVNEP